VTTAAGVLTAGGRGSAARAGSVGYLMLLVLCTTFSLCWLAAGLLVAAATYSPGAADALRSIGGTAPWARGLLTATARSEPLGQAVLDYALSLLNLVIGAILLRRGAVLHRLLALAMIGSAGAFNLQAHVASAAVESSTGLPVGEAHQILLHGVSCAAYIAALLVFPVGRLIPEGAGAGRHVITAVAIGSLTVVGVGTALLPHTVSCILFFGFAVPLAGLAALPRRMRHGASATLRTQSRLLFSVLLGAFGIAVVLGLLTVALRYLGETGLTLDDPTAHAHGATRQPTALLFWFSRLAAAAIAAAVLLATRPGPLWTIERTFGRGLSAGFMVVLLGAGFLVTHAAVVRIDPGYATVVATVLVAVAFLPLQARVERLVNRLLYGSRRTPYSVLAEVTALSRSGPADGPALNRVAEAIARGLGALSCRLTVMRPGLRDRLYSWSAEGTVPPEDADHLAVPIRHGTEEIGSLAVDRAAVAGPDDERYHLLYDIADSLGAVLQAERTGIELERQLRAALAHAEEIATSRRRAISAMDDERRAIERDLHDGAQHHLVTLRLALGLVEHQVSAGQVEQGREFLDQLLERLDTATSVLDRTAAGVSSRTLAERGLLAALRADLAGSQPPVAVEGDAVADRRFPTQVEAAVYFCCLEAVNNARKHAGGAAVRVALRTHGRELRFEVRDEGPGFVPGDKSGSGGRGLRNLTSRLASVGGRVALDSAPGEGTAVRGWVPLPAEDEPAPAPATPPAAATTAGATTVGPSVAATVAGPPAATVAAGPSAMAAAATAATAGPAAVAAATAAATAVPPRAGAASTVAGGRAGSTARPAGAVPSTGPAAGISTAAVQPAGSTAPPRPNGSTAAPPGPASPTPAGAAGPPAGAATDPVTAPVPVPVGDGDARPDDGSAGLTVGVFAPPGLDAAAARTAVREAAPEGLTLVDLDGEDVDLDHLDGLIALVRAERPEDTAVLRRRFLDGGPLGVAVVVDADGPSPADRAEVADRYRARPEVRPVCAAVVPLAGVGPALDTRFAQRAEALRTRATLRGLADSGADARRAEQLRAAAHELTELDLIDRLRTDLVSVRTADRPGAERLLGWDGTTPASRLGLPGDAAPEVLRAAARERLTYWRRVAVHPATTGAVREVAEVLVRTCERLLSG
jgi:signal transduction histidine kinase